MNVVRDVGTARLLIVDDDGLLRGMATRTLQHAGFEVTGAADGDEALALFAAQAFDLVLLDVMMPGIDGFEVCGRIRAMAHGARVPILILTGLDDTASIEDAYRHGATDFITKPINWTLLSHRVRYALRASVVAGAMRKAQERLHRAQKLAAMGNWSMFAEGGVSCTADLRTLFGAPDDEAADRFTARFIDSVDEVDRPRVANARARLATEGVAYQLEYRITRADQAVRTLFEQAAPVPSDPDGPCCEGITQDITERVEANERIRWLAEHDAVTGLPNRRSFTELAGPVLDRVRRNGTRCVVFHIDIDRFRHVNDAFGRTAGDEVLKTLADRLQLCIRSGDVVAAGEPPPAEGVLARVGGNAFTVLIADLAESAHVRAVLQRLTDVIERPIVLGSQALVLTASFGSALFPDDAATITRLSRCAEQAVHAAKGAGRGQHRYFDAQMNIRAAQSLQLETELRQAIAANELVLHYQPKVDAPSGGIVGAEALVRWQHPVRGLVPPNDFIPLAEESGLILALTDWVLDSACGAMRRWSDAGLPDVPVSVNLPAASLADAMLPERLDALMRRYRLAPSHLTLEVTETMLMRDVDQAIQVLDVLAARGYGLSLDDFGTGHSSLSYLKRLPFGELKVDRSFVTDAAHAPRDGALAGAIIALGRELGMQVVAEGVETRAQSAFLLGRGCHVQQGYLFSRAVSARDYEALLRVGSLVPAEPGAPVGARDAPVVA